MGGAWAQQRAVQEGRARVQGFPGAADRVPARRRGAPNCSREFGFFFFFCNFLYSFTSRLLFCLYCFFLFFLVFVSSCYLLFLPRLGYCFFHDFVTVVLPSV